MTASIDPELEAMIESLFSRHASRRDDPSAESDVPLWATLEELGLTRLTAPEDDDGSGATWREAAALLSAMAYHDVQLPIAEHDLLAGWLLQRAGLDMPPGITTAAVAADNRLLGVPFARLAEYVVALRHMNGQWAIATVPITDLTAYPGADVAGRPRDDLSLRPDECWWTSISTSDAAGYAVRHHVSRVALMCGAMERIVDLCREHALTRNQFGRPLARFQAVQTMLAEVAAETVLASTALAVAVDAIADGGAPDVLAHRGVVAASTVSQAATVVIEHAHQIHGAVGTTAEHALHRFSLSILAWRAEIGPPRGVDALLGRALCQEEQDPWAYVLDGRLNPELLLRPPFR
ncbi:acyl-CoA dehydrogenase family protein [Mycobacterium sp. NAZ190054]|uniref:acyl-CoA dehydrogenase family protein n=1 Tax=Mycobacterium sp. NAZ190054 TaxID=1747766 RepID=UPI0007913182|nr:acyl-CoA dehydrogenase family protein [Mycobacterium sp. NAZ190054]KWX56991.1 hypothetical protein ASJ79_12725 [Mycobacterium sp. NAZ190054]